MLALGLMSVVSAAGLWVFSRLAPRIGLVDQPNDRSLHEEPKVVGAGVVPVFLIAGYLFFIAPLGSHNGVVWLLVGLSLIGLSDDSESVMGRIALQGKDFPGG